jgi:hypothetical protein
MRTSRGFGLVFVLVCAFACGDGPNVQYLPIGSRCSSSGDCGTTPYNCAMTPGGYCQKTCSVNTDCPADSVCANHECRRKCNLASDCRASEGYLCVSDGVGDHVCDISSTVGDGGASD